MGKQIDATNGQINICQRFISGIRYIKVTPKSISPMIIENIKKTFNKDELELSENNGWLKIERKAISEKLEKATDKLKEKFKNDNINEDFIINKEVDMLKSTGFKVEVKDI